MDRDGDGLERLDEREVPGVDEDDLSAGVGVAERFSADRDEEGVAGAPDRKRRRAVLG